MYPSESGGSGAAGQGSQASPEVQEWFNVVDVDSSGSINAIELRAALLNGQGTAFSEMSCRMMVSLFDHDRNGTIDVREFQQLYTFINQWMHVFQIFDEDNNGFLNEQEVSNALRAMSYRLSLDFVQMVMRMSDVDNYQHMSFDQFIVTCVQLQKYTEAFRERDTDRKGVIALTYEDFLAIVLSCSL